MNVLVLGASGKTGEQLVQQGLARGHTVTAFVRDPAMVRATHPRLLVLQGDVTDKASVERALAGQEAVVSALGAATPFKRDPSLVEGVCNVLTAMERSGVRRFLYLSFLGVPEGRDQLGPLASRVAPRVLKHATRDHEVKEGMVRRSKLDWTIVRPPRLTNGRATTAYRSGERLSPGTLFPSVSRADVADFILEQLADDSYSGKAVTVMR